jgi:hypothetical protein
VDDKAGSHFEVAVKSGGPFANLFGGGMVGPAGFFSRFGGHSLLGGRRSIGNASTSARRESLREGEVQIKDSSSGAVVWEYKPDNLPEGMTEGHFIDDIEQDLENMTVEDFKARWRIKD